MSFYEDFIAEGHACAGCLEFFFEEAVDGVLHGVGYPRLCSRCQRIEEQHHLQEQQKNPVNQRPAHKPRRKN